MPATPPYVYAGQFLRVDLTKQEIHHQTFPEATLRQYLGGTGLGAKVLYDEVSPTVGWSDPENRLVLASGPLGGTRMGGSGTYSVVTKGPLTNGGTATQANGFFGAYLRLSGFDGVILQGAAPEWCYIYIHDGTAEVRDARHLLGKDTWETEGLIKKELGETERALSVVGIGPAGENLVRFAAICGDKGHVAGHNGPGAVMGSKKVKAIVAARRGRVRVKDSTGLSAVAKEALELVTSGRGGLLSIHRWGTLQGVHSAGAGGWLPIKNYLTNVWDIDEDKRAEFGAEYIRSHFEPKRNPCWACQFQHCHLMKIKEGPYAGMVVEEPEYEGFSACGPAIGNTDVTSTIVLANEVDRLGLEVNETGWLLGWVMESFEKGILTLEDTDFLEMRWGNAEAALALLRKIATRSGIGDILAEGVMRASQRLGAPELAIHTLKGNSPRGHDHRSIWFEMLDTSVSNSGTIETGRLMHFEGLGLKPLSNPYSPDEVSTLVAKTKGSMQFEDSLGVCRFNVRTDIPLLCKALKAATGWDFTVDEAMEVGRRIVNLMRVFNIRHGISPELDRPSPRYSSTPTDGPVRGLGVAPVWDQMLKNYYELMGWDQEGKPLPETLRQLGLEHLIA